MPLTDTTIHNAKPAAKPVRLFDAGGLYLEVAPSGGKWWRLKYRVDGKEKRLSLGVYPEMSLKAARERRDEARALLATGVDPGEQRKAQKLTGAERSANSFEVIAREWYARHAPTWAPGQRDVFPWIGTRPVADLNAPELLAVLRRIEARGAIETAHRARQNCGQVLGVRPDFIEHQLAHEVRAPNGRAYNHTAHLPERRRMMQQWADYLDALKASNVVPIRRAG